MNAEQQDFLEKLALRIPRLFNVIRQGNVKSEYIIGIRQIDNRHVRLKIVAEVVDPGINPLSSHGMSRARVSTAPSDLPASDDAAAALPSESAASDGQPSADMSPGCLDRGARKPGARKPGSPAPLNSAAATRRRPRRR